MNKGLCIVDNIATTRVEEVTVQWGNSQLMLSLLIRSYLMAKTTMK